MSVESEEKEQAIRTEENLTVVDGEEGEAADGSGMETLEKECENLLEQKDEECKRLQDRLLRVAAEMENTRKRLEREKADGICFGNESLIREFLPVIDNLERAVQHAEQEADFQVLMEGVRLTLKGFMDALGRFGCVPFESLNKEFDPKFHEAMMQQETSEYPDMTVIQEYQRGFMLRDRVIRPAMVVVSKAPKAS